MAEAWEQTFSAVALLVCLDLVCMSLSQLQPSGAGSQGDYQNFMSQYASDFQKYMQGRRSYADENQIWQTELSLRSVPLPFW